MGREHIANNASPFLEDDADQPELPLVFRSCDYIITHCKGKLREDFGHRERREAKTPMEHLHLLNSIRYIDCEFTHHGRRAPGECKMRCTNGGCGHQGDGEEYIFEGKVASWDSDNPISYIQDAIDFLEAMHVDCSNERRQLVPLAHALTRIDGQVGYSPTDSHRAEQKNNAEQVLKLRDSVVIKMNEMIRRIQDQTWIQENYVEPDYSDHATSINPFA